MQVLEQSPWSWTVVADGDDLLFSAEVLLQIPMSGQYDTVTMYLVPAEVQAYADRGADALDELAARMNRSIDEFLPRRVHGFDSQIGDACIRWRAERETGPEGSAADA